MSPMILVAGGIVVLVLIGALVFLVAGGRRGDRLDDLNQLIDSEWKAGPQDAVQPGGRSTREVMAERLDSALAKRGLAGNIRGQLRKADLKLTVSEYLILHVVSSGLGGLIAYMLRPAAPALAGVGVILGFFVPRIIVSLKQRQRLNAFQNQLADILNLWVNSLRAGFSVPQAMEAVAREAPAPASVEFKRVVAEISIGIPFETALNNMLSRIESEDLDLVFTAVNIQREVGGNLAEILDTISHTIRERVRIKGEIRTLTASGRATGTLISMLPIGLAVFMLFLRPEYMGQLFYGPPTGAYIPGMRIPCGWPIIALGLIMIAVAWGLIKRITDIEV
jgi:tight adherence protein B